MRFIIQMVLFVAICVAVFPGLSANPVGNEEQAIVMRNEGNEKWWACLHVAFVHLCGGSKSNQMSPECQKCASDCKPTCIKKSEDRLDDTPECNKCLTDCRENVCNI